MKIKKDSNCYYSYFKILENFLKRNKVKVINFSSELPNDVIGRIYYFKNEIHINTISAKEGFYTLLHEAGHWVSFKRYSDGLLKGSKNKNVRERYSYLYGWVLVKQLNFNISKEEYKKELSITF